MPEEKKGNICVGAFWKQQARSGKSTYLSGSIELPGQEKIRVVIFANRFYDDKGNKIAKPLDSKKPDFKMYLREERTPVEPQ